MKMKKAITNTLALIIIMSAPVFLYANNVQVSGVGTTTSGGATTVNFTLSWENSWRGGPASNYDAVWVFIKYKDENGDWKHLDVTGSNNSAPSGLTIEVPSDKKGVFVYRSTDGTGNISASNITLGVVQKPGSYDIKVFGIEMVYVPEGSFYLGHYVSMEPMQTLIRGPFCDGTAAYENGGSNPFLINSAVPPAMGTNTGELNEATDHNGTLHANFPTGYNAFYCMKYELSQGGYRDFLNTISTNEPGEFLERRTDLTATMLSPNYNVTGTPAFTKNTLSYRNGLKATGTAPNYIGCDANNNNIFNEADDGEWTACNFLGWGDAAAFLDWACLRPMTELEYEKAAKGPVYPADSAFATGSFEDVLGESITNPYTASESTTQNINNINIINYLILDADGPLRNGFAATNTSNRLKSGSSYYGIMELSGNLEEFTVSVSNNLGRSFQGVLGDGQLTTGYVESKLVILGDAIQNSWPGADGELATQVATEGPIGNQFSNFVGTFRRGGSFLGDKASTMSTIRYAQDLVSEINTTTHNTYKTMGCRGVRQQL